MEGIKLERTILVRAETDFEEIKSNITHSEILYWFSTFTNLSPNLLVWSNFSVDSGIHTSSHKSNHHQIIFNRFDSQILYPPMYEGTTRHYDHLKIDLINNDNSFEYYICFWRLWSKWTVFNNISSFIPNETTLIDDSDQIWIKQKIKG